MSKKKTFIKTLYNSSISFVYVVIEERKVVYVQKNEEEIIKYKNIYFFLIDIYNKKLEKKVKANYTCVKYLYICNAFF